MSRTIELLTYADMIDHLVDFTGANPSPQKERQAKRSIKQAYDNLCNEFAWPYYYASGRICTVAPYDTGTITYDVTGGSVERQVTLTDGVWPTWSAYGTIIIDAIMYRVAERVTDTILQLDINEAPHEDITDATGYTLMRDVYTLPSDFVTLDELYTPESWQKISYVHPRQWLVSHRYNVTSAASPSMFTVIGSPDFMGSMSVAFYPYPDSAQVVDFIYHRRGRPLRVERVLGVATAALGNNYLNHVSGSLFDADMIGSVIRVSASDDAKYPSGRAGNNPYAEERVIMDVSESGDQATVDQQFLEAHSNAKFTISDPIDIEPGIMTGALLRRAELEMAILARMEDRPLVSEFYDAFLTKHREFASPVTQPRAVGDVLWGRRLAYMPRGDDVE